MRTSDQTRKLQCVALLSVALWGAGCASAEYEDAPDGGITPGVRPHSLAPLDDAGEEACAECFDMRVVTQGLQAPYEIIWGPDAFLWITERVGRRVVRVDPESGAVATALSLPEARQAGGQDGVLGLALHPQLLQGQGNDYVYLAYTYDADPDAAVDLRVKLVRYSYDAAAKSLGAPLELIAGLPGSVDHNSGKLSYGPDDKLYYTIGDQGHNQFAKKCLTIRAQQLPTAPQLAAADWSAYQGKILRLNLDGSIPADNPSIAGVRSHVISYGHRNAQGIGFGPGGLLYAAEHGPKSDDEVNLIEPGRNYGWPHVAGYLDDQAYVYGDWSASSSCEDLAFSDYVLPESVPRQPESAWSHPDFTPPLLTFYTVDNDFEFMDPACAGGTDYICWPTIAPSSLVSYAPGTGSIPGWQGSLLLTSLKEGSVFVVKLAADGRTVSGGGVPYFKTTNRYRAITIAPDAQTFFVITDSQGDTSGPTSGSTPDLDHRGAVLEFRYAGEAML